MLDLFNCNECGFLSTHKKAFLRIHNELYCEYCSEKLHGVLKDEKEGVDDE